MLLAAGVCKGFRMEIRFGKKTRKKYGKNTDINTDMIENAGLVSVIMPAYNCADTVAESIKSVLRQTYHNWELLIVNDASTDRTGWVIARYEKADPRIRCITQEKNAGAAAARNAAIAESKGRFLAFLDADDLWKPKKLEKQLSFMLAGGYAFTFTAYELFKTTADRCRKVFCVPESVNYKQYLKNTIIGNLTVMMDCAQMGKIQVQPGMLEDVMTWMHYLNQGYTAYGLNENLASYRVDKASRSGNKAKNAGRYYRCLRDVRKLSIVQSCICECCYLFHALKKRLFGKKVCYRFVRHHIAKENNLHEH